MVPVPTPEWRCVDCRWLQVRIRTEGEIYHWCVTRRGRVFDALLRRPCRQFEPFVPAK